MGKKDNSAKIRQLKTEAAGLSSQISELETLLKELNAAYTSIKYELISHSSIKENYTLAGTKYLEETQAEQDLLKNEQRNLKTHKENAASAVEKKIKSLSTQLESINSQIEKLQ